MPEQAEDSASSTAPPATQPEEINEAESPPALIVSLLRFAFYGGWMLLLPAVLALLTVRALEPEPYEHGLGMVRNFVGEQQVPATILCFTLFAWFFWRLRYRLPLAVQMGVVGRVDLPPSLRGRYDGAAQLISEARRVLDLRATEVKRELSRKERDSIDEALGELEAVMRAPTFDEERFGSLHARAAELVRDHLRRWRKGELREYAESIGVAVAVALVLRFFVIEAFKIPSGSMIPTLMVGDHIFVAKYAYGPLLPHTDTRLYERMPPARGDVMVFKFPENKEQDFIKRVIALPGDHFEALDGRPVINGWLAPHCYVGKLHTAHGDSGHLYVEHLGDKSYLTLYDTRLREEKCSTDADCMGGLACRAQQCGLLQGPWDVGPREVRVMGDNRNNSHDSRSWFGGLGGGVPFENIKGRAMFVWWSWDPRGGVASDRVFVNVLGSPKLPASANPRLVQALHRCLRNRPAPADMVPPGRAR